LRVPLDFTLSVGLDLHARDPDETTHCRFRNALVKGGVYDDLLAEVCRQLEGHGLKLRAAEAALIDATLIDSASRPRTHLVASPQDRAEGEADNCPDMHFSVSGVCAPLIFRLPMSALRPGFGRMSTSGSPRRGHFEAVAFGT